MTEKDINQEAEEIKKLVHKFAAAGRIHELPYEEVAAITGCFDTTPIEKLVAEYSKKGRLIELDLADIRPVLLTMHGMCTAAPEEEKEEVNHPSHYNQGMIEVIDFIEDQNLNFNLGNVVKYACRTEGKEGLKDLRKMVWYAVRELARRDGTLITTTMRNFAPERYKEEDDGKTRP